MEKKNSDLSIKCSPLMMKKQEKVTPPPLNDDNYSTKFCQVEQFDDHILINGVKVIKIKEK